MTVGLLPYGTTPYAGAKSAAEDGYEPSPNGPAQSTPPPATEASVRSYNNYGNGYNYNSQFYRPYPPACPPPAYGYPPYGYGSNFPTREARRESDYYRSKLERHEKSTEGRDKGGIFGALTGAGIGALIAGLCVAPIAGSLAAPLAIGAVGGGLLGMLFGSKFGKKESESDAILEDANDDKRPENGSQLRDRPPPYNPYYDGPPGYGYPGSSPVYY